MAIIGTGARRTAFSPAYVTRLGLGYVSLADPKYDFKTTNSAAANTTAFNAALADAGPGQLVIPPGTYFLNPVIITDLKELVGTGIGLDTYSQYGSTVLKTNSPTADLVTVTSPGMLLHKIGFYNTSKNVTAGSALKVDIQRPHPTLGFNVGSNIHISHISVYRFYRGLNFVNAFGIELDKYQITECRRACIRVASELLVDGGDSHFSSGYYYNFGGIYEGECDGIEQVSQGGLVVCGAHKFVGPLRHIYTFAGEYAQTQPGTEPGTSVLSLGGGISAEGFRGYFAWIKNINSANLQPFEVISHSTLPLFRLENCNSGILMGVGAKNDPRGAGRSDTIAEFISCREWSIGPNLEAGFSAPYVFSACADMRVFSTTAGSGGGGPVSTPPTARAVAPAAFEQTADYVTVLSGTWTTDTNAVESAGSALIGNSGSLQVAASLSQPGYWALKFPTTPGLGVAQASVDGGATWQDLNQNSPGATQSATHWVSPQVPAGNSTLLFRPKGTAYVLFDAGDVTFAGTPTGPFASAASPPPAGGTATVTITNVAVSGSTVTVTASKSGTTAPLEYSMDGTNYGPPDANIFYSISNATYNSVRARIQGTSTTYTWPNAVVVNAAVSVTGVRPQLSSAANTVFSLDAENYYVARKSDAAAATGAFDAYFCDERMIGYTGAAGLQGIFKMQGLEARPELTFTTFGVFSGASNQTNQAVAAWYLTEQENGVLGHGTASGAANFLQSPSTVPHPAGTLGFEIWVYDNKVEYYVVNVVAGNATTTLRYTDNVAVSFPLRCYAFMSAAQTRVRKLKLTGGNLLVTPA